MSQDNHIPFEQSIASQLLNSVHQFNDRPAIQFKKETDSYNSLFQKATLLAAELQQSNEQRCLILSRRCIGAYVAILAALLAGKAYVILNIKESDTQLHKNIRLADSSLVIACKSLVSRWHNLTKDHIFSSHTVIIQDNGELVANPFNYQKKYYCPTHSYPFAYLMFTSGSTGNPKAVPISHKNLQAFLQNSLRRIQANEEDKFAQINELSFDFSVYELFCCWISGACLCILPDHYILGMDRFVQEHAISYWSCVPSMVHLLHSLRRSSPEKFQTIRYSVFCGEALSLKTVRLWKSIARNSIIENWYGPTEATVAISAYRWHDSIHDDPVPLGLPFDDQHILILDQDHLPAKIGEIGELFLSGAQVFKGYWKKEENTPEPFVTINGHPYYKTGDRAYLDQWQNLHYAGRKDDQLKLHGYRVEKNDIEQRIRTCIHTEAVAIVVLSHPETQNPKLLTCFFAQCTLDESQAAQSTRQNLPDYMLPDRFIKLPQLPLTHNGKTDYRTLHALIKGTSLNA